MLPKYFSRWLDVYELTNILVNFLIQDILINKCFYTLTDLQNDVRNVTTR